MGKISVLGILALVFGILSVFLFWIPFVGLFFTILPLIFGIVAIISIKKKNLSGSGLAISGIVIGAVLLIVSVIISILTVVYISKISSPETLEVIQTENITTSEPVQPPSVKPKETIVQTIGEVNFYAKNWDADTEIDGLEFDLEPKDKDDELVVTEGFISAKLYKIKIGTPCVKTENNIIESWNNIPVKSTDFDRFGATIRLPYKTYKPISSDRYAWGCAEVTFTTPDGKKFSAIDDEISTDNI